MTKFDASMDRDANYGVISSNEAFKLRSAWTFAAGTTGATGAHTVFTVTGEVIINAWAICTTDLTSGGAATVALGTATSTASLANSTTATTIDNHFVWHEAINGAGGTISNAHCVNENIILTVGTTTVTGGVLVFYATWRPLSTDGNVTVATPA